MVMEDNGLKGQKALSLENLKLFLDIPHIRTQYLSIKIQRSYSSVNLLDLELSKHFPAEL
jgi:hypothetical protein